ncbi:MAG: HAD-IIIC family phosphatase [Bryobacteraceae bacterium]
MNITEALRILQRSPEDGPRYNVVLACGFTPLHVQTFLAACLQQRLPDRRVTVIAGLYGDAAGTLETRKDIGAHAVALPLEWPDLDPRLGYRGAGNWGAKASVDIVSVTRAALDRIGAAVENLPTDIPVVVSLPTLPLPPLFHTPGWQTAGAELALAQNILEFASRITRRRGCSLVNAGRLAEDSPPGGRFDLKSDLLTGLPYAVPHAAAVGTALARLLAPPAPKKGLISDLDDTLWCGIVGEIGPEKVSWDLASHHQLHGLYQMLLAALAEEGVLIGVASKNDPAPVQQAFQREDLLAPPGRIFPMEVNWNAKSVSVERILRAWNIGADSVVFVDDSPMELAEVAAAHPGIECLLFPKDDYSAGYAMLRRLRDLFGKARISPEDAIRLESIRQSAARQDTVGSGSAPETFLQQSEAALTFDFRLSTHDPRVLELVNKTNQFNLNGVRYTETDWKDRLSGQGALLATISYQDKFGPLGKIAVVQGRKEGETLYIDTWVMSCRAFSRRIEQQCLKMLFDRYQVDEIAFDFLPTPKNGPLQNFFAAIVGERPIAGFALKRTQFEEKCPPLYHRVGEAQAAPS